jgi:hypothetical protein
MKSRFLLSIAVTACAFAQGPQAPPPPDAPQGRGRMGGFGRPDPGARFIGTEAGMPGRVVKNAPYSADLVTESVHTLSDGNHIRQTSTVKVYRDSEGRTRREQTVNLNGLGSNSGMPQLVFINDPVSGANYALNPKDRTATKSTWTRGGGRRGNGNPPPPRGARGMNSNLNMKSEDLGRQTMEGIAIEGRRTTTTIPAGEMGNDQAIVIVNETWYSPDLQTMVFSKRSDPRSGETITRMINISRGDPAHMLFELPADYKITEGRQ